MASKITEDEVSCPICFEIFKDPKTLPCFHTFCLNCIEVLEVKAGDILECPICRTQHSIPPEGVHKFQTIPLLRDIIERISMSCFNNVARADDSTHATPSTVKVLTQKACEHSEEGSCSDCVTASLSQLKALEEDLTKKYELLTISIGQVGGIQRQMEKMVNANIRDINQKMRKARETADMLKQQLQKTSDIEKEGVLQKEKDLQKERHEVLYILAKVQNGITHPDQLADVNDLIETAKTTSDLQSFLKEVKYTKFTFKPVDIEFPGILEVVSLTLEDMEKQRKKDRRKGNKGGRSKKHKDSNRQESSDSQDESNDKQRNKDRRKGHKVGRSKKHKDSKKHESSDSSQDESNDLKSNEKLEIN